jgi:integrase/recombinase XerD
MEEPMALEFSICEVRWERYRRVSENPHTREWLKFQAARGLAANTIEAYGRDLDRYLGFLETENIPFHSVIRATIGAYIRSITQLEVPRVSRRGMEARSTLANATLQQHLTVVRLFHDFLVEERVCTRNPLRLLIGARGLIQPHHRLPWIPSEEEWQNIRSA